MSIEVGMKIVNKILTEALDSKGDEQSRFKRFMNRFKMEFKSEGRVLLMSLRIWRWPEALWANCVNIVRLISQIGTKKNENMNIEFMQLLRSVGDGRIKTAKEFNNAKQAIMKKHGLKHQPMFDNVQQ